jgi:integration host factor subunit beta
MNKVTMSDIVNQQVEDHPEVSKKLLHEIIETAFEDLIVSLKNSDPVYIHNLGTFTVKRTNPRKARNPKTGEAVDVPAKYVVRYRMSKYLRDILNP